MTGILEFNSRDECKELDLLFGNPNDDFAIFSNFFECGLPLDEPLETHIPTIPVPPVPVAVHAPQKQPEPQVSITPLKRTPISCAPTISHFKVPRVCSSVRFPMMLHTEGRAYELLQEQLELNPTPEQLMNADKQNFYLRWIEAPPERIHATSPSRLVGSRNPRPGAPFYFTVQLVSYNLKLGKYVPYPAPHDLVISAHIYGKRKPKTGSATGKPAECSDLRTNDYVKLITNPIGKPLLVRNGSGIIDVVLKKGETTVVFDGVSLTCGSNAARSKNAPQAARGWDWDYHILIKCVQEGLCVYSLMSKHITTDSNRSQTREKRKRGELIQVYDLPSPKKMKVVKDQVDSPESSESSGTESSDGNLSSSSEEFTSSVSSDDLWSFSPFENSYFPPLLA